VYMQSGRGADAAGAVERAERNGFRVNTMLKAQIRELGSIK